MMTRKNNGRGKSIDKIWSLDEEIRRKILDYRRRNRKRRSLGREEVLGKYWEKGCVKMKECWKKEYEKEKNVREKRCDKEKEHKEQKECWKTRSVRRELVKECWNIRRVRK
jgi:hypothetical protein